MGGAFDMSGAEAAALFGSLPGLTKSNSGIRLDWISGFREDPTCWIYPRTPLTNRTTGVSRNWRPWFVKLAPEADRGRPEVPSTSGPEGWPQNHTVRGKLDIGYDERPGSTPLNVAPPLCSQAQMGSSEEVWRREWKSYPDTGLSGARDTIVL